MSEQPSQGVKQKFEGLYEALSRKHAMEYARLIKEYEEMALLSGKTNKEEVATDQELHRKMEENAFSDERHGQQTQPVQI